MSQPAVVQYALKERSVELREIPIPQPSRGNVLLKIAAAGICGTDVHQYLNEHSWPVNLPVVMGHEFSGIVHEVGEGVRSFAPGDRVVCETAAVICGDCYYCRTGRYHFCEHRKGFGQLQDGGFTQYVQVPVRCLHRVPKNLPLHLAALTEPSCVAYHATAVAGEIKPGMSVAVLGCGTVGLICVRMAKMQGGGPIVLTGLARDKNRLQVGKQMGATHIVDMDHDDLFGLVRQIHDGHGIDVVIDVSGRNRTLKDAIDIVRPAGQIIRAGWGPGAYNFSLDPLVHKGVRLQGVFSHNWEMWERVLRLLDAGKLDLSLLSPECLPIERWQEGFEAMCESRLIKAVLEPNGRMK
ncbi:MAG TPA: zinc-binding dehydrogenase [bacterium]|nr:zinc-binding dehydrogenase [Candidatus Omnitrophota bacterium]HOJ60467.1 zinc-binding dehydrogenase [bacterium]HOL94062.1 zinc-binding dehydrogenase [bacterium]HPP01405.1 zinc-binding dehydrogenase [bacterium]HXK92948.1 zinc-binding dehydrogenase [bacterium]